MTDKQLEALAKKLSRENMLKLLSLYYVEGAREHCNICIKEAIDSKETDEASDWKRILADKESLAQLADQFAQNDEIMSDVEF